MRTGDALGRRALLCLRRSEKARDRPADGRIGSPGSILHCQEGVTSFSSPRPPPLYLFPSLPTYLPLPLSPPYLALPPPLSPPSLLPIKHLPIIFIASFDFSRNIVPSLFVKSAEIERERGEREGWREGGREGGREGQREGGREGGRAKKGDY